MSRYAEAHANPQGPGDARPTALQIIEDEGVGGKLSDKVIVITGTSSGIGIETVRALSATGARLFLTARNLAKAKEALSGIFDPVRMELVEMNQESLHSVRLAADSILSKTDKIHILVNNAGIMAVPTLQLTQDGHELHFGTNHLSHFLFFELLKPALLAAASPDFHSRVVVVSSTAHLRNGINASDDYNFEKSEYSPWGGYAKSKTANIYMANELERRYGSQGLHGISLHPGGIMTPLAKHLPAAELVSSGDGGELYKEFKSPEQGAATTVWAAVGKQLEGRGGIYLAECAEAEPSKDEQSQFGSGYAKHAFDQESEGRLWKDSLRLVGLASNHVE
ncbi:NAD(P)-binding protein [Dissoconium aciculare CBS 342.82]|uniref:NAD(P)-binding protein n=1 Tax=Dissoconium aciculare CBS 342.82 TaxID=1314786 RepID=A0A6J3MA48_9PEZI|nr:NAD(P)-binding protein [Dissoconium aciculare CBS 342.82]KAF1824723.1 NAD(P)-binding protein [Dissoconium aciculare CBS 342.82]